MIPSTKTLLNKYYIHHIRKIQRTKLKNNNKKTVTPVQLNI